MISRRWTISNQRWNNIVYVHVEIYNVQQRQINVAYFNVDINNVIQRRNNVVILNVEFHNVDQSRNKVVYITIFKKLKTAKKYFWASKKRWLIWLTKLDLVGLWSIKKKGKHGTYNIKINIGRYNVWYMKGIRK